MISKPSQDKVRFWLTIMVIAGLSLWIRVSYFHSTYIDKPMRGDAASYVQYALNLVNYGTFSKDRESVNPRPDAYWPPGYPALLATAMQMEKRFGISFYETTLYTQAVIGALIAVVTLLIGRLFLNHYAATLAALFVAFSPHLISLGGYLLTETLFSFALLLSIYVYLIAFRLKSGWLFLLSGLAFGLAYLVNPVVFFAPVLFAGLTLYLYRHHQQNSMRTASRLVLPSLLAFFLIVGGWSARNLINVSDSALDGSERLFTNLVIGMHHDYHAIWRANPRDPNNPATVDERQLKGSYPALASMLIGRIGEAPLHFAHWYLVQKPIRLWDWNILTGQGDIYVYPVEYSLYDISNAALLSYAVMRSAHYWLFGFALLGLIFVYRQVKVSDPAVSAPLFLYVSLVYVSAVYVVAQAEARYSIPMRPEMYLCAVYFLSELVRSMRERRLKSGEQTA